MRKFLNLHRRHLNESQRAMVAAKMATLQRGRPSGRNPANLPVLQSEAAAMLGVSERSVRTARAVINEAAPELARAVESGRVSVSAAARLVDSLNVHRRHLTASQRAAAIVARHEWRPSGKSPPGGDLPPTTAEMAKEAQVSERTIKQAKAAHAGAP